MTTCTKYVLNIKQKKQMEVPLQIPNCSLWLDGSDTDSITTGSTFTWADKSGQGNDVSQSETNRHPTLTTVNGLNALLFADGDFLINSSFDCTSSMSFASSFFVDLVESNRDSVFSLDNNTSGGDFQLDAGNGSVFRGNIRQTSLNITGFTDSTNRTGVPLTFLFRINASTGDAELYSNGQLINNTSVYNGNLALNHILRIAAPRDGSTVRNLNGKVMEFAFYERALSNEEINTYGNYSERWGLTWTDLN